MIKALYHNTPDQNQTWQFKIETCLKDDQGPVSQYTSNTYTDQNQTWQFKIVTCLKDDQGPVSQYTSNTYTDKKTVFSVDICCLLLFVDDCYWSVCYIWGSRVWQWREDQSFGETVSF